MSIFRRGRIDYCIYPNWYDKPKELFVSWFNRQICKFRPHVKIVKFTGSYCDRCGKGMGGNDRISFPANRE